jgi:hypothetical protein
VPVEPFLVFPDDQVKGIIPVTSFAELMNELPVA